MNTLSTGKVTVVVTPPPATQQPLAATTPTPKQPFVMPQLIKQGSVAALTHDFGGSF